MTKKPLPIDVNALTYEDRVLIRYWSGEEVPDDGNLKLTMTTDQYKNFLGLMCMLGQRILHGRKR